KMHHNYIIILSLDTAFSGMWHIMAAVSNCPIFQSMKDLMKTSAAIITVTPEDNLHFKIGYPLQDGCKKIDWGRKGGSDTAVSGHHLFLSTEMGKQDMRVVATDYTNYAIVYTFKDDDGKSSTTLQLYSRIQKVNPEAMKTFKELYPAMGLTDNMLVIFPKSGWNGESMGAPGWGWGGEESRRGVTW
uniref:Lipocalin/cytosolic fatty-acid binding domain-containing protein n=1 Tax=Gopherus evgoodei TaxID=1825980 RepID=A0A8C4WAC0_9SAUR